MEIRLSTSDGLPVYRQIVNQIKYLIASGRLRPGQELPAIRSLAEKLVINPNTVVHAYAELEKDGVVISRHGSGTYVAETAPRSSGKEALQAITGKVDSLLADAVHLEVEIDDLVQFIRQRYTRIKKL